MQDLPPQEEKIQGFPPWLKHHPRRLNIVGPKYFEITIGKTDLLITKKDIRIGARPIQVKQTREKYFTHIE